MAKKSNGKLISVARPKKYQIDTDELEKLASYGCTVNECAEFFDCPPRVISESYREIYRKGFNILKKRLRMAQIKAALGGNVVMMIWLGKNYLSQSDKNEMDVNVSAKEISERFAEMVSSTGAGSATSGNNTVSK